VESTECIVRLQLCGLCERSPKTQSNPAVDDLFMTAEQHVSLFNQVEDLTFMLKTWTRDTSSRTCEMRPQIRDDSLRLVPHIALEPFPWS
jgi:hypothetical protein